MNGEVRILHVDNEPEFAAMTAEFLEREADRFTVETAAGAADGLDRLADRSFDCVVSDYDMPGRNGIEFLEAVRAEYPDLPFVLFTGKGSEEIASDAISAGVTDYLQKGTGPDQYTVLANRIENAVSKYRAEQTLERYKEYTDDVLDAVNDVFFIYDEHGTPVRWNDSFRSVTGYSDAEIAGMHAADFVPEEDRDRVREAIDRVFETGRTRLEVPVATKHGTTVPYEFSAVRVEDPDGNPRIAGIGRDISERKDRERRFEQLQRRTQPLMNTPTKEETARIAVDIAHEVLGAPLTGFHLVSDDGRTLEPIVVVDTVREELGEPPVYERADGTDPASEVVWDAYERGETLVIEDVNEYDRLAEVTPSRSAIVHPLAEHGVFIVSATEPNAFDETDKALIDILATSLTTALDRTERERQLEAERDRFQTLFEHLSVPVVEVEYVDGQPDPIVRAVNPAFETQFGYDRDTIVGESLDAFIVPSDRESEALGINERALNGESFGGIEVRRETADGQRDFLLQNAVYPDEPGGFAIYTDITDRKRAEADLRLTRDRMEFALEATDSVIYEVDLETGRETHHGPFERLYGLPSDTVATTEAFYERAVHPADRAGVESSQRAVIEGGADSIEVEYRTHPDAGPIRWIRSSMAHADPGGEGAPERLIGLATDITRLKERERELERQNDRLEGFASVVSHDLRNPLSVARGQLELARREGAGERLETAEEALERMEMLIDDLLTLAREGGRVGDPDTVELADTVKGCWGTIETADATLAVETDRTIRADRSRLQQLLENLIRNAVEHAGNGVTITVGDLDDGFYVADTGPGVPPDERERVFEAGYSTGDGGTGLGLSIVADIADAHGWAVTLTASDAGGARFEITGVEVLEDR